MPTYDYECIDCKVVFEHFQGITEKPLKKCRDCGGRLKRLFGAGQGIIFKGSGFYETDYKRPPKKCPDASSCEKKCEKAESA